MAPRPDISPADVPRELRRLGAAVIVQAFSDAFDPPEALPVRVQLEALQFLTRDDVGLAEWCAVSGQDLVRVRRAAVERLHR